MSSKIPPGPAGGVRKPQSRPPKRFPRGCTLTGEQDLSSYSDSSEDDAAARPLPAPAPVQPALQTGGVGPGRVTAPPMRPARGAGPSMAAAQPMRPTGGAGPNTAAAQPDIGALSDADILCDAVVSLNVNKWSFPTSVLPIWAAPILRNSGQVASAPQRPLSAPSAGLPTIEVDRDRDVLWVLVARPPQQGRGGAPPALQVMRMSFPERARTMSDEERRKRIWEAHCCAGRIQQIRSSSAPYSTYTSADDRKLVGLIRKADNMLKLVDGPIAYVNPFRMAVNPLYLATTFMLQTLYG